ncbi:MAG: hypothetical protein Q9190_004367 [Brigantiaea leucoxantha]
MYFQFVLPTTSKLAFSSFLTSSSHPSLPLTASTRHQLCRDILKQHKRLSPSAKSNNLTSVSSLLSDYLPFLFALEAGLTGHAVNGEEVDVILNSEIETEWRTTLAGKVPGTDGPRARGRGLDFEICFVLNTLAYVHSLLARVQIHSLYASIMPSADQRLGSVNQAKNHLLQANSIHTYLMTRFGDSDSSAMAIETQPSVQGGLAALALAEATLLAVLSDDPYPTVVTQERNKNDKEWMIKAPEIPKVRAHLFARLCLAAAEHSEKAEAMLSSLGGGRSGRIDQDLIKYTNDLKKLAKAKACRFFGIDAELGGETGKAIAWLQGARRVLGFSPASEEGSLRKGFAKFRKDFAEKKEDKRIEKGADWGSDAGRLEEARVIDMLEKKWTRMNDTMNTQLIPPFEPLLNSMPSGRDVHQTRAFNLPVLDADILERMRAPPEKDDVRISADEESSDDEPGTEGRNPPGTFPSLSTSSTHNSDYF